MMASRRAHVRGITFWDTLWQDIRFGCRTLRRSPGYTAAAISVLALGIGANTAMFSVIRGVLLAPLPFPKGHELVLVQQSAPASNVDDAGVSIQELDDYRSRLQSVRDLVEFHSMSFVLLNQGEPDRIQAAVVSANFFDMLGVRPLLGRTFRKGDDDIGAEAVLVLSHEYWQSKFGGEAGVIGRVLRMNNRPHTVVGVLPPFPQYPVESDVYMSTSACPFRAGSQTNPQQGHRSFAALRVFGRLADGAAVDRATAEVKTVAESFNAAHAGDHEATGSRGLTGRAASLQEELTADSRPLLLALGASTLLILILACANVANLALALSMRRVRELGLRTALGAGRARLFRQLATESLIVAAAGGVLGLALAYATLGLLVEFVGRFTPRTGQIGIDGGVLLFALAVTVATGLVFGARPAMAGEGGPHGGAARRQRAGRREPAEAAPAGRARGGAGRRLVRPAGRRGADDREPLPHLGRATRLSQRQRADRGLLRQLQPDEHAGRSAPRPGTDPRDAPLDARRPRRRPHQRRPAGERHAGPGDRHGRRAAGRRRAAARSGPQRRQRRVLRSARGEDARRPRLPRQRHADNPPVAIINRTMAAFWGGSDPIGGRFTVGPAQNRVTRTVVGVVEDFRLYGASERAIEAQFYIPYTQVPFPAGRLLVRSHGNGGPMEAAIRTAVHGADAQLPVEEVRTLDQLRRERLTSPGVTTALLAIFASVALAITLAGLAGLVSTSVSQRTREFGLRIALGASRGSVLRMVLSQGTWLVLAGIGLGAAGAFWFAKLISRYLFATPPTDPVAYALVALVLVGAALVATFGPALRATTVDPLVTLKDG